MKQTNTDGATVAKGVLVGAAVIAGVAAAMALRDKKNRKKFERTLSDMRAKGIELKKRAEDWVNDEPMKNGLSGNFSEKNPIKKAARAIASA